MQDFVMLEAVQQRGRRARRIAVRNTAVPGTRAGGFFSKLFTRDSRGVSRRRVFSNSNRLPRRQVYITNITKAPNASGIQPPSKILSRLAERKARSMNRNGSISASAPISGQRQIRRITMIAIMAVTTMVP